MTVAEIAEKLELECQIRGNDDREVIGAYIGDLLSWVMGRAQKNCAWITIMSNVNVAAVGVLTDVSVIILAEGVAPDADLIKRAEREELNIYSSPLSAYELSWRLHELLISEN